MKLDSVQAMLDELTKQELKEPSSPRQQACNSRDKRVKFDLTKRAIGSIAELDTLELLIWFTYFICSTYGEYELFCS